MDIRFRSPHCVFRGVRIMSEHKLSEPFLNSNQAAAVLRIPAKERDVFARLKRMRKHTLAEIGERAAFGAAYEYAPTDPPLQAVQPLAHG